MLLPNRTVFLLFALGLILGMAGVLVVHRQTPEKPEAAAAVPARPLPRLDLPEPVDAPEILPKESPAKPAIDLRSEPAEAVGQHVIIAFDKSALGTIQRRTRAEALALARNTADRLSRGEAAEKLVMEVSDDPMKSVDNGIRRVRNFAVREQNIRPATPRIVLPAYADALFQLNVGEVTLVEYDASENDLGYIVIKRIE